MTRGPAPVIWKDSALPVANVRGHVMIFAHSARNLADFVIVGSGTLASVRMRKVRCLHSPPENIEAELRNEVSMLRRIPGGSVSRELWPYSRYGVLRFFRVEGTGLVEIGADGKMIVISPKETVSAGVPIEKVVPGAAGIPAPTDTGMVK
ncbi:MAG: hypothetical protein WC406_10360 [Methanoregula sp.]